VQILWINLLTDGFPALALGADPSAPNIMERRPRRKEEGVITSKIMTNIFTAGIALTATLIIVLVHSLPKSLVYAQTVLFTSFVFYEFIRILIIREKDKLGLFTNRWLLLALVSAVALQMSLLYTPLGAYFNVVQLDREALFIIFSGGVLFYALNKLLDRIVERFYR
jgi:Ca2+-transporting ATPase